MKKVLIVSLALLFSLSLAAQVKVDTTRGKANLNHSFSITTAPPDSWIKKPEDTLNILHSNYKNNPGLKNHGGGTPLIIIDGERSKDGLSSLSPNDVESMNVLNGEKAIAKYGKKAKDGVILITTKKK